MNHAGRFRLDDAGGTVARIVVLGGESSGKSTLVRALVARYDEPSVAEYGRTLYEEREGRLDFDDLRAIGVRHVADEEAAAAGARRCVFVDTSPLTTLWYALDGHGAADPALVRLSWRRYDLTIVCAPDFAFVDDGFRASDDFRLRHDRWLRATLRARGVAWIDVQGPPEARLAPVAARLDPLYRGAGAGAR